MFSNTWLKILIVVLLFAGLFVAGALGWLNGPKGFFLRIFTPAVKSITWASLSTKNFFISLATINQRVQEWDILSLEIKKKEAEIAQLEQYRSENSRLRELLSLKNQSLMTTIAAALVSRDPTGVSGIQLIDKGNLDGIKVGGAVLDEAGNLLGTISHVYEHNSEFLLLTDGNFKVDAEVPSRNVLGIVNGSHTLGLSFELVSQNTIVEKGDRVVTSGLSETVPAGLLIGYIDAVQSSESELFKRLSVLPAANLKSYKYVFVVTNL